MLAQAINARCSLPVLLPFPEVSTNWCVITGTFSSGKSTLLGDLRNAIPEAAVMDDAAREVILRARAWRGPNGEQLPLTSILRTQVLENEVFATKWERHLTADPLAPYLLDYGLPDVIAFARSSALKTSLFEDRVKIFRYRAVFILDPLRYESDETREWNSAERERIHHEIATQYRNLGYSPITVPVLPPRERCEFVLERLRALPPFSAHSVPQRSAELVNTVRS